jgi:hypothetical protein
VEGCVNVLKNYSQEGWSASSKKEFASLVSGYCRALTAMAKSGKRVMVVDAGAVPVLVEVARQYNDPNVLHEAKIALDALGSTQGEKEKSARRSRAAVIEELKKSINSPPQDLEDMKELAISCVEALKMYSKDGTSINFNNEIAPVVAWNCRLLGELTKGGRERRDAVVDIGAVPVLVAVARQYKDNLKVQRRAMVALGNFCVRGTSHTAAFDESAVRVAATALRTTGDTDESKGAVQGAFHALAHISALSDEHLQMVIQAGVLIELRTQADTGETKVPPGLDVKLRAST